jgi:hypothetical protein
MGNKNSIQLFNRHILPHALPMCGPQEIKILCLSRLQQERRAGRYSDLTVPPLPEVTDGLQKSLDFSSPGRCMDYK